MCLKDSKGLVDGSAESLGCGVDGLGECTAQYQASNDTMGLSCWQADINGFTRIRMSSLGMLVMHVLERKRETVQKGRKVRNLTTAC